MSQEEPRDRILTVATRLFAHRGYGGTSVREVVEAAGVTKPTLYYWFASKEALYLESVRSQLGNLHELVREAIQGRGTVRERLEHFLERYLGSALENRDGTLLVLKASYPTDHTLPVVDVATSLFESVAPLAGLLAEGIAKGELRDDLDLHFAVFALVGTANMHLMAGLHDQPLPADCVGRILDTWLRGTAR